MKLLKQLAGETVIYGIGHILPRIFHYLIFSTYLTYKFTDNRSEYAIYLDLYAYASVLIVLFSYRMDTALFRFGRASETLESTYRNIIIPMLGTSAFLVGLGIFFSDPLATILTYPGRGYYIILFSLIIALDVIALIPLAKLRLESRAKTFVFFKLFNVAITVCLVLFFLEILPRFSEFPLLEILPFIQSEIDFVFLSNLIASTIMLLGLIWVSPVQPGKVDFAQWRKMIAYAWPLIIVGIAGSINQFFGVPLQKYLLGNDVELNKDQAGIYGAVQKIPALLAMFTTAYNYAAEPFFFRNADRKDARQLYGDIALFFTILAGFVVLAIFVYIDLFQYFIGPSFREGLYIVPYLLIAYLFLGLYYNVSIWYKLSDQTKYGALIAIMGAIITLSLNVLLLGKIGYVASAYAALVCYLFMVIAAYHLGQIKYPIQYPIRKISSIIALVIVFLFLGNLLRQDSLFANLLTGTIALVCYVACVAFLSKSKLKEYNLIG